MARCLIIDDEKLVRHALRRILERDGHLVAEAPNGADGCAACRLEVPDLVICDMLMPVCDGLATFKQLRDLFPAVRFIAMSGGARTSAGSYLDIALRMGAAATLAKPFSKTMVLDTVASVLNGPAAGSAETSCPDQAAG